jgi:Na+-translocating ferredoxin:NAD+ oxidoreductase RnfD subunit
MLNLKLTGRRGIIVGWLGGWVLQAVIRWLFFGVALLGALSPLTGVAFVLFTTYMITDPATTPNRERNQVIFGGATAICYGCLLVFHIVDGMFFALTLVCVARGLILIWTSLRASRGQTPGVAHAPAVSALTVASAIVPAASVPEQAEPVEVVTDGEEGR